MATLKGEQSNLFEMLSKGQKRAQTGTGRNKSEIESTPKATQLQRVVREVLLSFRLSLIIASRGLLVPYGIHMEIPTKSISNHL